MEEKTYTSDEVAKAFQISKHTVYELIKRGELQALKVGNNFIVAKENPKGIYSFLDLTRKDIQFVNRQKGSGTRFLLDSKLSVSDIKPEQINGYENEEWNHLTTASYISRGNADVAFGIRSAASHLDLDFVPIAKEQFNLVLRFTDENKQHLTRLINYLQSQEFKASLTDIDGYDLQELGAIIYTCNH